MQKVSVNARARLARPTSARAASGHRTRVGRERRARTEARILAAAVEVFGRYPGSTPVIDEFIKAAGVAHGTFYNYFKNSEQLLQAASKWLEDDLIVGITAVMTAIKDPGERVGTGVRLWLRKAETDPAWCAFVARQQLHGALVERELTSDLRAGLRLGVFSGTSLQVARDLVVGTTREAMVRMSAGPVPAGYAAGVVRVILRGLGLEEAAIVKASGRLLPPMPAPARGLRQPARPRQKARLDRHSSTAD